MINDPLMNESTYTEVIDLWLQCNQRSKIFACGLQIQCRLKFVTTDHRANTDSGVEPGLVPGAVVPGRAEPDPTTGPQFASVDRCVSCYKL